MTREALKFLLSDRFLIPALSAIVFVVYLQHFVGPTQLDYYPGVVSLPTVALAGVELECPAARGEMQDLDDTALSRLNGFSEPYYLDQRLGQPALLVPFYLTFGKLGFRIAYALWRVGLFLVVLFLAVRFTGNRLAAYLAALGLVFNPLLLGIRVLNPNIESSVLAGLVLLTSLRSSTRPLFAALAGLCTGLLFGVAHVYMAILAFPGLVVGQLLAAGRGWQARGKALALFAGGMVVPMLCWYGLQANLSGHKPDTLHVCLGKLVLIDARESWARAAFGGGGGEQEEGKGPGGPGEGPGEGGPGGATPGGLDPCKDEVGGWHIHKVGPLVVAIWGMLNWPFNDSLVRSGGVPFPFMLYMPFVLLTTFGALMFCASLLGFGFALGRKRESPLTWVLLLHLCLVGAFLGVQENIGGFKFSFVAWLYLPMAVFAAAGLAPLLQAARWKPWAAYLVLLLAAWGACVAGSSAQFPLDQRWISQFNWKGIAQRIGETESAQAARRQQVVTSFSLLPATAPSYGEGETAGLSSREGLLASELEGGVHRSENQAWLTAEAVSGTPADALVLVNPYLETDAAVLADTRRCVIRTPALKPGYELVVTRWLNGLTPVFDRGVSEVYLVDSVSFPIARYLGEESVQLVHFNGYNLVYRVLDPQRLLRGPGMGGPGAAGGPR